VNRAYGNFGKQRDLTVEAKNDKVLTYGQLKDKTGNKLDGAHT